MADWKKQVGALNGRARKHAQQGSPSIVRKAKLERITELVKRMKERAKGASNG